MMLKQATHERTSHIILKLGILWGALASAYFVGWFQYIYIITFVKKYMFFNMFNEVR